VHQLRVNARRLRSAMQGYRPLLDRERTEPVVEMLREFGRRLAPARDAEVLEQRIHAGLAELPDELRLGPVQALTTRHFARIGTDARAAALAELDGESYVRLRAALEELLVDPPLTKRAKRPASRALPGVVARSAQRLSRAVQAANDPANPDRDVAVHAARKAAKRLRYATDVATPAVGKPAKRFAKGLKRVQTALGEHQDTVVARAALRDLGALAAGENGFSFGVLHGRDAGRAARIEAEPCPGCGSGRGARRTAGGCAEVRPASGTRGSIGSVTARDPVTDLRRIAFLLERRHESTYRIRAFRTAAAVLRGRGPDELTDLARSGELLRLRGVGERTARCVLESLAGDEPSYLRALREDEPAAAEVGTAAADVRAALRGDCHSHTDASDGGSPLWEMVQTARELGHEYLVITDHSPRLTVANGLSADRLRRQVGQIQELNAELTDFTVLTGIEVDILDDGALDQEAELLDRLDVVVASVHSTLRMPAAAMTERMLTAIANPLVDVLGHCTGRRVTGSRMRPESQFDADAVFAACVQYGVAVEINSRPERLDPPKRLLRKAVEAGCEFTIDTDAHAPGQLDWLDFGCSRAADCGVPVDRVRNSWPLARLLGAGADR
jgi:putative hydrolase